MTAFSTGQRIGLAIGMLIGLDNCVEGLFIGGGSDPTPIPIVALSVGLGALIVGLLAVAWKNGTRRPVHIAAVLIVLNAIAAIPAFAVPDVPVGARLSAGFAVLGGFTAIALLYSRRTADGPSSDGRGTGHRPAGTT